MKDWQAGVRGGGQAIHYLVDGASAVDAHNAAAALTCKAKDSVEDLGLNCAVLTVPGATIQADLAHVARTREQFLEEA